MSIKTKMKINFAVFMTTAAYMTSGWLQTAYGSTIRDYLTLNM